MKREPVLVGAAAAVLVLVVGLAARRGGEAPIAPPQIVYGQDVCSRCNMIISDDRFAAATVSDLPDRQRMTYIFDDIGCAIEYEREQPNQRVLARYVTDVESRAWLDAGQARFVRSRQIESPMAYGVAALGELPRAEALADKTGGQQLDLHALRAQIAEPMAKVQAHGRIHDH